MAATFVSAFVSALESVDTGRLFYDEESWYSDLLGWCIDSLEDLEHDYPAWCAVTYASLELRDLWNKAWRDSELHEYQYGGCDWDPKSRTSVASYTGVYPQRRQLLPRRRTTHAMRKAMARRAELVVELGLSGTYVYDEDIPF